MKLVVNLIINGLAVFITTHILSGVTVTSFFTAIVVAVILGIINIFLKPILLIFTLPINILTFGLFTFVINGVLIIITSKIVPGFFVKNIWWAILFSLILSVVNWFLHLLTK